MQAKTETSQNRSFPDCRQGLAACYIWKNRQLVGGFYVV